MTVVRFLRGRRVRVACVAAAVVLVVLVVLFPGRRFGLAFTISTGVGRDALQERIDGIEDRAIRGAPLEGDDRAFLSDLYRTLATGGRLTVVLRQTGRMMDHYLDGSGEDFRLDPEIFTQNTRVQGQMALLRRLARKAPPGGEVRLSSPTFYMPDGSKLDSVFGLYDGTVHVTRRATAGGATGQAADAAPLLHWRAEVPWTWPSYASLEAKHGTPRAERFAIPSLRSFVFGRGAALRIGNGLGERLAQEGLAKPFLAFAEWDEVAPTQP